MFDCDVVIISDQNGDQAKVLAKLGHDLGWQKSMPEYNKSNAKKGEESSLYLPSLDEIFVSRLFRVSVRQTVMRLILPIPALYTWCIWYSVYSDTSCPYQTIAYF